MNATIDRILAAFAYGQFSSIQAKRDAGLDEGALFDLVQAGRLKLVAVNVAHGFSSYRLLA